ncbi:MAG TPA: hypothetical protein VFA21_05425 [Pyrinomonadaceae bacterium]|nr:hypothetical protein [Pyrinomonadaceae bacterium]
MKKQITVTLFALVTMLVLASSASAQTTQRIGVNVPFDFVAGGRLMPAGHYTVRRLSFEDEKELLIRSDDGRSKAIVMTDAARGNRAPESAMLVFRQYGESYFLAAVSIPGTADVREVPQTKSERRRAHEVAERSKSNEVGEKTVNVPGSLQ